MSIGLGEQSGDRRVLKFVMLVCWLLGLERVEGIQSSRLKNGVF